jgi:hypothetical protein
MVAKNLFQSKFILKSAANFPLKQPFLPIDKPQKSDTIDIVTNLASTKRENY